MQSYFLFLTARLILAILGLTESETQTLVYLLKTNTQLYPHWGRINSKLTSQGFVSSSTGKDNHS